MNDNDLIIHDSQVQEKKSHLKSSKRSNYSNNKL